MKIINFAKSTLIKLKFFQKLNEKKKQKALAMEDLLHLEERNMMICNSVINNRLKMKKYHHEKVNIVFLCFRPAVWAAQKTVYETLSNDPRFDTTIVVIPRIDNNSLIYENEGYFESLYDCIEGYDRERNCWFDIRKLNPDYVFYQQPYNSLYPRQYKSDIVSRYAKICYIAYYNFALENYTTQKCYNIDFLRNTFVYFAQNKREMQFIMSFYNNSLFTNIIVTGYPKYESLIRQKHDECKSWNYHIANEKYRVIWTPRWRVNEGACNFFKYNDLLLDYCEKHKDIDLLFRPHPNAFTHWVKEGDLTKEELEKIIVRYQNINNVGIHEDPEYFDLLSSSDCLLTDITTLILDYFLTRKPIIYCVGKGYVLEGVIMEELLDGCYHVNNWEELVSCLENLKKGNDPLSDKREELYQKYFKESLNASENIKKWILCDCFQEGQ